MLPAKHTGWAPLARAIVNPARFQTETLPGPAAEIPLSQLFDAFANHRATVPCAIDFSGPLYDFFLQAKGEPLGAQYLTVAEV
jgi:hypothetical protein